MVVEDDGTGAAISANDTTCPTRTPERIWVRRVPVVPTVTRTTFGVVPSITVTVRRVPTDLTADVGTVVTPVARARTICTVASAPENGPSSVDWMPIVTGYVVVDVDALDPATVVDRVLAATAFARSTL